MLSTEMKIQALKVIGGEEIDRSVSRKYAVEATLLPVYTFKREEAKYAAYLLAHYLYQGDIEAFEEKMLDSDKRKTKTWVCEFKQLQKLRHLKRRQQKVQKVRRQQEFSDLLLAISVKNAWDEEALAENKVSQDIRYTSLHDWDWKKETKTFELIVRDNVENAHKFIIFDEFDIKTVWKRTEKGYLEVGRWMGDEEENEEGALWCIVICNNSFSYFSYHLKIEILPCYKSTTITTRGDSFYLGNNMTKLQPCFFFEPKEELYTGEETPLDLLLNGISLSDDIQSHINGFLDEESEHPYLCGNDPEAYLLCHDDLNNEYVFPIDNDEKHCFEDEIEGDFVVDEQIFTDFIL